MKVVTSEALLPLGISTASMSMDLKGDKDLSARREDKPQNGDGITYCCSLLRQNRSAITVVGVALRMGGTWLRIT